MKPALDPISADWLQAEDIALDARLSDKRAALEALARCLARRQGGSPIMIFDALSDREALGSTGLGHGVALPHARLAGLDHPIGAVLRLQRAVAFDAPDDKPVDLLIGLLLPRRNPEQQLKLLAHLAERLSEPRSRQALAQAATSAAMLTLLTGAQPA